MNEQELAQEEAHYHFCLGDMIHYIHMYGIQKVIDDVYEYWHIEMKQQQDKLLAQQALWIDYESRN